MNRFQTPKTNTKSGSSGFVGIALLSVVAVSLIAGVSAWELKRVEKQQKAIAQSMSAEKLPAESFSDAKPAVLGTTTQNYQRYFEVNVPSVFHGDVQTTKTNITGELTLNGNVTGKGVNVDLGNGKITAGNVVYSLQGKLGNVKLEAGEGIKIDGLKISATDSLAKENLFKKYKTNSGTVEARSTSDTLTLVGGDGMEVSANAGSRTITISATEIPLGANTSGDYVKSLEAGTGVQVANNSGEGSAPRISLSTTGVTAGSYTSTNITVDAYGRITSAGNGSSGAGDYISALTGDVTATGPGSATATIASNAVTLGKMAQLSANSIIGNSTASSATPIALSVSDIKTMLSLGNVENTALSTWAGTSNIVTVGTVTTGTWHGSIVGVGYGGTGVNTLTPYAVITGGTTATGATQQVPGVGNSGQILTSNGAGALPTWQDPTGSITGSGIANQFSYWSGTSTLSSATGFTFDGAGSISATGTGTFGNVAVKNGTYKTTLSNSGSQSADITYVLPVASGGAGEVLKTDASGNLYWATIAGGSGGIGTVTSVGSGNGLTGGPVTTSGTLAINLLDAQTASTATTSSYSGLEFVGASNQLSLIHGCSANEVLSWNNTDKKWQCASISVIGGTTGSGVANQVAYWSGTTALSGNAGFTFNGNTLGLSASSAPTADMASISNAGNGTVTNGVDGISIDFTSTADSASDTNSGINIAFTPSGDSGDTGRGINIATSGISAGSLYGINIAGITGGTGTETALVIGSGWDKAIDASGLISTTSGVITPKIYPSADSTTAIQINKADGTTNVLNVDTTNGRVGIGTTSPGNKLTITGPTTADALADVMIGTSATTQKGLVIQGKASQTANLQEWQDSSGTAKITIDNNESFTMVADNSRGYTFNGGAGMYGYTSGGLGIKSGGWVWGFSSNAISLNSTQIYFTTSAGGTSSYLTLYGSNNGFATLAADGSSGYVSFKTNGSEKLRIDSSGNVGIGTTSPGNRLTVTAPTTADALADVMIGASATTQKGLVIQGKASQTANLQEWQNSAGTVLTSINTSGDISLSNADNRKINMTDAYGVVHTLETDSRTTMLDINGTNYIGIAGYGSGHNKIAVYPFVTMSSGSISNIFYAGGGVGVWRYSDNAVPTTTGEIFRTIGNTSSRSDTVLLAGASGFAANDERQDGVNLMLAGGNGAISGTSVAADGGSVYAALGAPAGAGTGGHFEVRTLGGTELMRVGYNGNVGIGTTNPGATLQVGGAGENLQIYQTNGTGISNIKATGTNGEYMYLTYGSSSAIRFFSGSTKRFDLSYLGEMSLSGASILLGDGSTNTIKQSSSDPIGVNGMTITNPLWITGVAGYPGSLNNARHALDINFSLGGGGVPASGTVTGGNAGKLNVYLRAGGAGSGGAAAGTDGSFNIINSSSANIFSVLNSGNVGIGTTSPTTALQIDGDLTVGKNGFGTQRKIILEGNGTDEAYIQLRGNESSGGSYGLDFLSGSGTRLYASGTDSIVFGSMGYLRGTWAEKMRITGAGNVGIGTTSPGNKLTITGPTTADALADVMIGASATTQKGLVIQGKASQTANLFEAQLSTGAIKASITSAGDFTNSAGIGDGEKFGYGATLGGIRSLAFGNNASGGTAAVALGSYAVASGYSSTAIGYGTTATTNNSQSSIAIGYGATSATGQFVAGVSGYPITDVFFGKGVTDTTPTAYTINGTGGSGTNIGGAALQLAGGKATGNAVGGPIYFQTSDAGASGTDLQSLTTKMTILASGNVGIGTTSPGSKLELSTIGDGIFVTVGSGNYAMKINNNWGIVPSGSDLVFHQFGGSDHVTFQNSTGNVGLGTTSPRGKLDIVASNSNFSAIILGQTVSDGTSRGAAILGARKTNSNSAFTGFATWDDGTNRTTQLGGGGYNHPESTRLEFYTAPTYSETNNTGLLRMAIDNGGNVGIGVATPTAALHLKAGTATASTAPLKFTSGTNLTTAEAGAMEFDGTNFYLSPSTTRYTASLYPTTAATTYYNYLLGGAGNATMTGTNNTALGYQALLSNTYSAKNVAIGSGALYTQSYANGNSAWDTANVAIGYQALYSNQPTSSTNGFQNTAIGHQALYTNTTGSYNTATGYKALYTNSTGNYNTAYGFQALTADTTSYNTAFGYNSLKSASSGDSNTAIGANAMYTNTIGTNNVALGYNALYSNTSSANNTALGFGSLYSDKAADNSAVGYNSLYNNTYAQKNTAIGRSALYNQAYANGNSGWDTANTAVGYQALYNTNPTSSSNGYLNTSVGSYAGYTNATGASNVFLGYQAGYYETGSNKLFIDNAQRASEADGRLKALIYGVFDASPANQSLTVNGALKVGKSDGTGVAYTLPVADGVNGQVITTNGTGTASWGTAVAGSGTTNYNAYWSDANTLAGEQYTALSRGGTNNALTASNGGIVYSDASKLNVLAGTATANQMLMSGASGAPSWSTATYPSTVTANQLLYATGSNALGGSAGLTFDGSMFKVLSDSGNPQMRLAYDADNYVNFTVSSLGNLNITPSTGGSVVLATGAGDPNMLTDSGKMVLGGNGNTYNEKIKLDFETTANTVAISSSTGVTSIVFSAADLGDGAAGNNITIGNNTNATNTGAGSINLLRKDGTAGYIWQDNSGNVRINSSAPTNAADADGTVIGTQSSTRETKQDIQPFTDYQGALQIVSSAPLNWFRYKNEVRGYGADDPLAKKRLGFIADEVSPLFMWDKTIDQVSVNGLLIGSVKALKSETDNLNELFATGVNATALINGDGGKVAGATTASSPVLVAANVNLNVLGTMSVKESAVFGSEAEFNGKATFNALANFAKAVSFGAKVAFLDDVEFGKNMNIAGDANFLGRPTFNKDTAGRAVIKKGVKRVEIVFEKEYVNAPVVNASLALSEKDSADILSAGYSFAVVEQTTKGFSIVLNKKAVTPVSFSWVALAVKDAVTTNSPDAPEEQTAPEQPANPPAEQKPAERPADQSVAPAVVEPVAPPVEKPAEQPVVPAVEQQVNPPAEQSVQEQSAENPIVSQEPPASQQSADSPVVP